ncbi:MAG: hypothetical protein KBT32_08285 [Bacteroidales bacterium]|nr:hypothetical protein [Candidatus Physcocola equi]
MSDNNDNNKRIAQNTILLYVRMIILMIVNLYTSRVVLSALGIEDYGLYEAIAGFISMFSLLSGSLSSAISRYITFVLGENNIDKLKRVFSTSIIIILSIATFSVILSEVFGVWFLNAKMTIPIGREDAANWVFQFSLLSFVIGLWSTPYDALIIAHERMNAFAYIGIFEGLIKLLVAILISFSSIDRLIFYAALMCVSSAIIRIIYSIYCSRNFQECKITWIFDKKLFQEMFTFAGWNFIGFSSGLLRNQGINILFNIYYGPVINAARGLSGQVNTALTKFSQNFVSAIKPQITKSYAENKIDVSNNLTMRSSRLTFFLFLLMGLPFIFESDYILSIWLKEVPPHTSCFVKIIIINSLIDSISQPLIQLMLATGNIKKYQILVGATILMSFPFAWIILCLTNIPELAQSTLIIFSILAMIIRIEMLNNMTGFNKKTFYTDVICKSLFVILGCCIYPMIITIIFQQSFGRLLLTAFGCIVISSIVILVIGLKTDEKEYILLKIRDFKGDKIS